MPSVQKQKLNIVHRNFQTVSLSVLKYTVSFLLLTSPIYNYKNTNMRQLPYKPFNKTVCRDAVNRQTFQHETISLTNMHTY